MTDQIIKDGVDLEIPKAYSNGYMSAPIPAQFTYLPWDALYEVAKVLTENCVDNGGKYEKDNWRKCPDHMLMLDGLLSHVHRLLTGEGDEEEHLTHIACRALMMVSIYLNKH
jgi:hypothetical protein